MMEDLSQLNTFIWTIIGILVGGAILIPTILSVIGLLITIVWSITTWIAKSIR
jgi:hypothetical protein